MFEDPRRWRGYPLNALAGEIMKMKKEYQIALCLTAEADFANVPGHQHGGSRTMYRKYQRRARWLLLRYSEVTGTARISGAVCQLAAFSAASALASPALPAVAAYSVPANIGG